MYFILFIYEHKLNKNNKRENRPSIISNNFQYAIPKFIETPKRNIKINI